MTVTQPRAPANCLFTVAVALLAADGSLPLAKRSGQVAPSQVERLAAGGSHSCASIAAQVYCWGSNDFGELGDRSTATLRPEMVKKAAVRVSVLSQAVSDVAPGHSHTCALVVGEVVCWGSNQFGQTGASTEFPGAAPTTVGGLGGKATAVAASYSYSCAVVDGAAKCWGGQGSGPQPRVMAGLERGVTAVAAGQYHLCAIVDGAVKCLYFGSSGTPTALLITGLDSPALAVGVGSNACALVAGRVKCWEVGDERFRGQPPRVVEGLPPDVTGLSVGWMHACALSRGLVWCWGDNTFGQTAAPGKGDAAAHLVQSLNGVSSVAAGDSHTCAANGRGIWCWGDNRVGQLGHESSETCEDSAGDTHACSRRPARVVGLP